MIIYNAIMKKTIIITSIATPILTLGVIMSSNAISSQASELKEAIHVANTPETIQLVEKEPALPVQEAVIAPEQQKAIESQPQTENLVVAPTIFPKEDFRLAMFNESERLSPEKVLRMNSMELVSIAMRNIPDLTTEDVALNMLRQCKAFYGSMQTGSQEYSQARYNQACS